MRKYIATLMLLFWYSLHSYSQNNITAFLLPSELKKDANAIVRENYLEINLEATDRMVVKQRRIITVLNKLGNKHVNAVEGYDNDTKITELSAKVYDAFGKEIKKYSKKKFTDVSAVDGVSLYSDSRVKYLNYTPTSYPYTVVFESEYKTSSTGFIPKWFPQESFYVSIQKSEYKINNPNNFDLRIKKKNFEGYPIKSLSDNQVHYIAENMPAVKYERNSIYLTEIAPELLVALNKFTLKGVSGNATNWKEFGKWMNDKLLFGKTALPPTTVAKIKSLVNGLDNDIAKAKKIYEFVQDKTRYISVQIGIGGWEPIPASEVDKMGYGDCKGLTNYTKALFDAAGITSYYTLVYAKEKQNIDKEFSSLQGNHVILNIPNEGKDVWLECTSQSMPFGFIGDFTDDRDVLVITPEGGVIKHTDVFKNEDNLQVTKAKVTLSEAGDVNATVQVKSTGIQYDHKYAIANQPKEDIEKHYKSNIWDYNNNLELTSFQFENDKDNVTFKEDLEVEIKDYASITENELLFRVNIFNRITSVPKRYRKRNLPLKINRGFKDIEEYTITFPNGYAIDQLPPKYEIDNKFGTYTMEIKKIDDHTIAYHRSLLIKDGLFPKEDYKAYRKFRKNIAKRENLRIALQKQQ
ncbi:DUF3857 domain-containing protein [Tenacibaculum amylolyticum]|uniref:DUF3857 domain-containing protein n=1 Tax=Tenacibaculum amylolyticum TaxID=104269 RepID=UPI0038940E9C